MPTLDELLVKIDASTELLRRELKKGENSVTKFERGVDKKLGNIDKRFAKLGAGIKNAIGAFGIAASGVAVAGFTRSVVSAGLEMERYDRALKFATGSQIAAGKEMDFLRETADRLGLSLQPLVSSYVKLSAAAKGTELEGQGARDIFVAVSEAATVLGLSSEQTEGALRALEQMISKGNVQAEELRGQLGERLPGAFQIAARAMGVTTEDLNGMLERGEVLANDLLPKLAKELHKTFGPQVAEAAASAQGQLNKFSTSIFELKAAIADSGVLTALTALAHSIEGIVMLGKLGVSFVTEDERERMEKIAETIDMLRERRDEILARGQMNASGDITARLGLTVFSLEETEAAINAWENKWTEIVQRMSQRLTGEAPIKLEMIDVEDLRENGEEGLAEIRRFFEEWAEAAKLPPGITRLPSSTPNPISPTTIRLGGESAGEPPVSEEELARVNEALAQLEEQALRSQGRMVEAIRMSAQRQIEEWERVAEETPALAGHAAQAIEHINAKMAEDIEDALHEVDPAIQQFANSFAAAFESRGIDALLNGDISEALRGMAKDLAELIIRLTVLRPLAEGLASGFTSGGFLGGLFGGGGSGALGPPMASGGRLDGKQAHLVGEFGPEMFVPDVPGRILNSAQLAGMSGNAPVVNIYNSIQAGLPPQWDAALFKGAQLSAAAAKEAVSRELGGRR